MEEFTQEDREETISKLRDFAQKLTRGGMIRYLMHHAADILETWPKKKGRARIKKVTA